MWAFAGSTRGLRYGNDAVENRKPRSPRATPLGQSTVIQDNGMAGANAGTIKARIIEHMNADHSDSLEDYLKFYNSINAAPHSAKLVEFDLDFMKIEYTNESGSKASSIVKIDPPMSNLAESRVRLVAMAEEATGESLHQPSEAPRDPESAPSNERIGWTAPEGLGFITLSAVCFGFWALNNPYPLSAEGPLVRILPTALVLFGRTFREQLFAMMIGLHVIEGMVVASKCLEQRTPSPMLVLWTINGIFEGFPAIMRINKLIAKQGEAR
jgi:hypothetical protein